jgi:His/Glu/Gln/Arg/opine family amino acid ABC transporter permease subunit
MDISIVSSNLDELLEGAIITVAISVAASLIALFVGSVVGVIRSSRSVGAFALAVPVQLLRGTPALVLLYLLYYGGPSIGITLDAFAAAVIALGLNGAAYVSECVRAGIRAVPRSQVESARALGMGNATTLRRIVIPQALPIALPSITNEIIDVVKWSSLGAIIVAGEITQIAWSIVSRSYSGYLALFVTVGCFYLAMTTTLSVASRRLESVLTAHRRPAHV